MFRYCDEQFVKAQARELAEAANMSNQQFNSAARLLLERERAGEIELPMTNRGTYRWHTLYNPPLTTLWPDYVPRSLLEEDWDPLDYVPRCPDPGHASPPPPPSRHRAKQGARRKWGTLEMYIHVFLCCFSFYIQRVTWMAINTAAADKWILNLTLIYELAIK